MIRLSSDEEKAARRRFEQTMEDNLGWASYDLRRDLYDVYENKSTQLMWEGYKACLEYDTKEATQTLGYVRIQKDEKTGVSVTSFSTVQEKSHYPIVLHPRYANLIIL